VADSISAAVLSVEAAPDETTPSNSEEIDEKRDTDASPPILLEHRKDAVARERGIEPIAEPYVRESMPVVPQETPRSRRVVIVSMSFAAVCLAVSGGAIIWAQDAVAEAQTKPMANVQPMAPLVVEEQVQARAKPAIEQTIEMEAKPAVEQTGTTPDTCKIAIDASVADSRVKIDGKDRGLTPLSTSVPCGQPMAIEVRHARYATYERTITVTAADEALHAKLEREKTTVTLTSDPPAAVTLNGTPIGKTPMKWTVSRFEQSTFRFSAPGYETDWRRIHPKRDTSTVLLKLKRQR
jgi:hypothetical protein